MSRLKGWALAGLALLLAAGAADAQFRPVQPYRPPVQPYRPPVQPYRPPVHQDPIYPTRPSVTRPYTNPHVDPFGGAYGIPNVPGMPRIPGLNVPHAPNPYDILEGYGVLPPGMRPGSTNIPGLGRPNYNPQPRYTAEEIAELRQQMQRQFDSDMAAYRKSENALGVALKAARGDDPVSAVRLIGSGYNGMLAPIHPSQGEGIDQELAVARAFALKQLQTNFRQAVANKLAPAADPWPVFAELVEASSGAASPAGTNVARELLADAGALCARKSMAKALTKAEAGDWAGAVAELRRADEALNRVWSGEKPGALTEPAGAIRETLTIDRNRAAAKSLTAALRAAEGGDVTALREVAIADLSPELAVPVQRTVRTASAAAGLREVLADTQVPSAGRVASLASDLRETDPQLADRVLADAAGRLFLEGNPVEARLLLGQSNVKGAQAAALLRDLKAVALGEGTVETEAGQRAVAGIGGGNAPPRVPPAVSILVPEGDRAGYRPPVAERATDALPPLDGALKSATAARVKSTAVEVNREEVRLERREVQSKANMLYAHAAPQITVSLLRTTLLPGVLHPLHRGNEIEAARRAHASGFFGPLFGGEKTDRLEESDEDFIAAVEQLLGRRLTAQERITVLALRQEHAGRGARFTPRDAALWLLNRESAALGTVRELLGALPAADERAARYLHGTGRSPREIAEWLRPGAVPPAPEAPAPRVTTGTGADQ